MNLRTPWSQTRFQSLLKLVGFCASQVIAVEAVAGWLLKSVEIRCFHSYKIAYIAGANKGSACLSAIFLPEVAFHRRSRTAVICLHRQVVLGGLKNCRVVHPGPGNHYLREDHPQAIGSTIHDWLTELQFAASSTTLLQTARSVKQGSSRRLLERFGEHLRAPFRSLNRVR